MPDDPLAVTQAFVECINRRDLEGLAALLHDDHRLEVLDEPPLVGRAANVDAWRGYFTSFPRYVIHVRDHVVSGDRVTVVGATTGSHLALPDDEERRIGVLWVAEVVDGLIVRWAVLDDTPFVRAELGVPSER